MRAKRGLAAFALLLSASLAGPAAPAASQSGHSHSPAADAQIAHISREDFDARLNATVAEESVVKTEEGDTLRVELHDEAKVLFFTRPGHRAHPGVVEVRIVEEDKGPGVDTAGWWAGDGQAFKAWFRVFQRRNERLSRQWQMEAGPF